MTDKATTSDMAITTDRTEPVTTKYGEADAAVRRATRRDIRHVIGRPRYARHISRGA